MEQSIMAEEILTVKDLRKHYPIRNGVLGGVTGSIKAVDGVSFSVKKGETFSIVGESGCGKSTTGMCMLRLIEPTSGQILFNNENLFAHNEKEMRKIRRNIQIVFQDPYSSLNPKHTIRHIISEPLLIHRVATGSDLGDRVASLLTLVGLGTHHLNRYPHEFSGGQRQRIGIARALALNPQLLICDEPVSALDVSIQSQILNLLQDLQQKLKLTYVFISHDLSVVEHISDRVAVMYLGRIVETGPSEEIFQNPRHPYTKALLSSVPIPDPKRKKLNQRVLLEGDIPSPKNPPEGCHFQTRCPHKTSTCMESYPQLAALSNEHYVACHLVEQGQI